MLELNITLVAVAAPGGGAILTYGELSLAEVTLSGSRATAPDGVGGAIANFGGVVQISASELRGNLAPARGGAIGNPEGELSLETSLLEANQARDGGAIARQGSLTIQTTSFEANQATSGAGSGMAILGGATITASSSGSAIVSCLMRAFGVVEVWRCSTANTKIR